MTSYEGWHAELYDLFYADKPYEEEASFVDACLRELSPQSSRRILELACGTGRHALALENLGYEVHATDNSQEMLAVARRRAAAVSSGVDFRAADMRSLDLSGEQFDAAVCLFDSLGYVLTNEAVTSVLHNVRRHLRAGGMFVFEFWHAAAMLRGYDPVRVRRIARPAGEVLRISETELLPAEQTCRVTYSIYDLRRDGTYRQLRETQSNRYFGVQEMAALLSQAGFTPLKWFAGFTAREQITAETWHVVAVAKRM